MADNPLAGLSDDEFRDRWPELSRECSERMRRLTPWVKSSVDAAERAAAKLDHKGNGEDKTAQDPSTWPEPLDLEALAEREPEPPRFVVNDWLPCGYATLFAGHGGVGKSGIALHLAVCIAAGVPFFGIEVQRRRVLYLSCEDRERVLHWRLARICAHLGFNLGRLRGWLEILDLVGHDCVLWDRDPRTGNAITMAHAELAARMATQQTEVLVVDSISDAFAGSENIRAEVKRFVNSLVALIPPDAGAVLLVGHIAKPTAAGVPTSEGYSGSTGWHNAARARWYLYPETREGEDGERAERTGDLILELQKSNLGRADQEMRFAWNDEARLFVGRDIVAETAGDRGHRDRIERDGVLAALRACADPVPAATTGQRTAYHVLAARPEFPDSLRSGTAGRRRFWRQVEALRAMGAIDEASIRRADRHYMRTLVAVT